MNFFQADAAQRYASSGAAKKQQCRSSAKSANVPGHVKTQTLSKTSLAHTVPHKINTPKTENQNTLAAGSPQLFSNMNILQTAPPMAIASNVSNPRTSSSEAGMHGNHNMPLVLPSNMNATLKLGSSSQSIQVSKKKAFISLSLFIDHLLHGTFFFRWIWLFFDFRTNCYVLIFSLPHLRTSP